MQLRKSNGYKGIVLSAKGSDPCAIKIPHDRISNKMKEFCNEQINSDMLIFI